MSSRERKKAAKWFGIRNKNLTKKPEHLLRFFCFLNLCEAPQFVKLLVQYMSISYQVVIPTGLYVYRKFVMIKGATPSGSNIRFINISINI
jgi:hypothetical protein